MSKIDSRIANLGENMPAAVRTERAPVVKVNEAPKQDETTAAATLTPEQLAAQAAIQATTEEVSEDANVIDPNKPILLPNGERITFKEWNDRGMRYDQYVRKQSETDAQYKARVADLEKKEADYTNAKAWRATAEGDSFANAYLLALSRTNNPQEALKEAQRVSGVSAGVNTQTHSNAQPTPPNDDPGSPEYNRWFMEVWSPWQADQAAQRIAKPQIDALTKEVQALRSERQREQEMSNAEKQRADENAQMAATAYQKLYNLTGIDVASLPQEEAKKVSLLIEQGFAEIGLPMTDVKLWSTEQVRDRDVESAIRASFGKLNNPYVQTQAESKLVKPRQNTNQLHNAAPATGQNGSSAVALQGSTADRFATPIDRNISRLVGSAG